MWIGLQANCGIYLLFYWGEGDKLVQKGSLCVQVIHLPWRLWVQMSKSPPDPPPTPGPPCPRTPFSAMLPTVVHMDHGMMENRCLDSADTAHLQCYTHILVVKSHWTQWDSLLIRHKRECAINLAMGRRQSTAAILTSPIALSQHLWKASKDADLVCPANCSLKYWWYSYQLHWRIDLFIPVFLNRDKFLFPEFSQLAFRKSEHFIIKDNL